MLEQMIKRYQERGRGHRSTDSNIAGERLYHRASEKVEEAQELSRKLISATYLDQVE